MFQHSCAIFRGCIGPCHFKNHSSQCGFLRFMPQLQNAMPTKYNSKLELKCCYSEIIVLYYTIKLCCIIFYCNSILTAFCNCSIIVKKPVWLVCFLTVRWLNTPPEDGTGMLKHVGIAIL